MWYLSLKEAAKQNFFLMWLIDFARDVRGRLISHLCFHSGFAGICVSYRFGWTWANQASSHAAWVMSSIVIFQCSCKWVQLAEFVVIHWSWFIVGAILGFRIWRWAWCHLVTRLLSIIFNSIEYLTHVWWNVFQICKNVRIVLLDIYKVSLSQANDLASPGVKRLCSKCRDCGLNVVALSRVQIAALNTVRGSLWDCRDCR